MYFCDQTVCTMRILVTGASGFIGSHMVEHFVQLGHEVWAAVRSTSSRRYLRDERIRFIELDYADCTLLRTQLQTFVNRYGKWNVIIHCAGATRCVRQSDFYRVNYNATRQFVDTLIALDMVPRQFLFMSTLGTYGPLHETPPYLPIIDTDIPQPNTHYGRSKRMAEEYLIHLDNFPYVFIRPTGVYGPRDHDYRILINSIRRHTEWVLGFKEQSITFVYVKDLVQAVALAIEKGIVRRAYFVTDGFVYTSRDFGRIVREVLGHPFVLRITVPRWMGRVAALFCDAVVRLTRRSLTFNSDKYRILSQRNWSCDIHLLENELGYHAQYDLHRGIAETLLCDFMHGNKG